MELSTKLLNVHISLQGHLWQVIEPLLRSDVSLPEHVFEHLCKVEIQIVENLAWASDSPLWEEVKTNEGRLPPCKQVRITTWTPDISSSVPHWLLVTFIKHSITCINTCGYTYCVK